MKLSIKKIFPIVFIAILCILPLILGKYQLQLYVMLGIFVIYTISLNLVAGFTGQFSMGHAGFVAVGAYTSALLSTKLALPLFLSIPAAGIVSALAGLLIGTPCLKVKNTYLSVMTIGFGTIVYMLANNLEPLTGGVSGIMNIPRPKLFNNGLLYCYFTLFFVLLIYYCCDRLIKSSVGRAFIAVREDQLAASAMGINVAKYRLLAFVLSAAIAGVGGSLYAHFARFINPEVFNMALSTRILVMTVVGGLGSLAGSVLGGVVIYLLPEMLRFLQDYYYLIYGVILILILLFLPDGLISFFNSGNKQKGSKIFNVFKKKENSKVKASEVSGGKDE